MDVLSRLDEARAQIDVLQHPFYRRWVEGTLAPQELAFYAGQYRHAVIALAEASGAAAACAGPEHRDGLERHAEEEQAHVALWDAFAASCAEAAGVAGAEQPAPGTRACAESWTAGSDLLERLAVLYAIEASQPEISQTKLEGLREHYAFVGEGPAHEYFELHRTRDVEHADAAGELIVELLARSDDPAADTERMLARARAALEGNWRLLDEVEARG